jgi:peptide/nickel transport system ATP-binding protein
MYGGSVVEIADTETLFNSPLHPYSKGLMNAIPKKERRGEELYTIPGVVPEAVNPPSGCRFHPRCPSSEEVCRRKKPVQVEVEAGHIVACHLQGEAYER